MQTEPNQGFYFGLKVALNGGCFESIFLSAPDQAVISDLRRGWECGKQIISKHPKPDTIITTDILYRAMIGITPENHPIAYKILSGLRDNK